MERKSIRKHRDLEGHQMTFRFAPQIFHESRLFPMEQRYSLTDRVCRSSRSVSANMAEAYRKRRDEERLLPITLI